MAPGVVVNDPWKGCAHGGETKSVTGGDDAESKTSFSRREPPLNHGQHGSPHARGANANNRIEEAGGPELLDGAHEDDANSQPLKGVTAM